MRKREAGFTILEVIAVTGISGLLAAVSAPSLSSALNAHRLTAGLRTTTSAIRVARSTAVVRNRQARVVLTNDGRTINVEVSSDGTNWTAAGEPVALDGGVRINAVEPSSGLRFATNGTLAAPVTVTVRNAKGDSRQVAVSILGSVDLS